MGLKPPSSLNLDHVVTESQPIAQWRGEVKLAYLRLQRETLAQQSCRSW
jgi:hypothetical protein